MNAVSAVHHGLCARAGGAAAGAPADEERSSRGRPAAAAAAEAEVLQREKSCLETSKVSHFFALACLRGLNLTIDSTFCMVRGVGKVLQVSNVR